MVAHASEKTGYRFDKRDTNPTFARGAECDALIHQRAPDANRLVGAVWPRYLDTVDVAQRCIDVPSPKSSNKTAVVGNGDSGVAGMNTKGQQRGEEYRIESE